MTGDEGDMPGEVAGDEGATPNEVAGDEGAIPNEAAADDSGALVRRLRRHAAIALAVLAVATWAVSRRWLDAVAVGLGGLVSLLSFEALVHSVLGAVERLPETPGAGRVALMAGRLLLLALVLCGIFLLPGIRPIPLAIGLSVLVLAILVEALTRNPAT